MQEILLIRFGYVIVIHLVVFVDSTVGIRLLKRDGVPHFTAADRLDPAL